MALADAMSVRYCTAIHPPVARMYARTIRPSLLLHVHVYANVGQRTLDFESVVVLNLMRTAVYGLRNVYNRARSIHTVARALKIPQKTVVLR